MTGKDKIIEEAISSSSNPKANRLTWLLGTLAIIFMMVAVGAGVYAYIGAERQAEDGANLAEKVHQTCTDSIPDAKEIRELCEDAERVSDGVAGPPGPQGEAGPPPTDSQVLNAVALYCEGGRCEGKDATATQVATAVALYCNNRGQCRGPSGQDGSNGIDGVDGEDGEDGADGPPPTAEQVSAAVASYCSTRNNCIGPQGPEGAPGVVNIESESCASREGQYISEVRTDYSPANRTITVTCDHEPILPVPEPEPETPTNG